jgi:hypothetical protein
MLHLAVTGQLECKGRLWTECSCLWPRGDGASGMPGDRRGEETHVSGTLGSWG